LAGDERQRLHRAGGDAFAAAVAARGIDHGQEVGGVHGLSRPNLRAAIIASQQQPQQLQMKLTPSRTFSPNCTRPAVAGLLEQVEPSDVDHAGMAVADQRSGRWC
jgi:hypothetical protein